MSKLPEATAKGYDPATSEYVSVNHPTDPRDEEWRGPLPIAHFTEDHVWVRACHSHLREDCADIRLVGDGRDNAYGPDGDCILSIPIAMVRRFLSDREAGDLQRLIDADDCIGP